MLEPRAARVEPELLMESLFRSSELEARSPVNMNVLDRGRAAGDGAEGGAAGLPRPPPRGAGAPRPLPPGKIEQRLQILDGLLIVFLNLDEVIRIIRIEDEPKPVLMATFKLDDIQADAILNMRLRQLAQARGDGDPRASTPTLTKEQKDLKKLLGSDKQKSERLIGEMKAVDAKFGLKTELGKRRTKIAEAKPVAQIEAIAEEVVTIESAVEREPITVVCSQKGWLRAFKGHQEPSDAIKYREGDRNASRFTPRPPTS